MVAVRALRCGSTLPMLMKSTELHNEYSGETDTKLRLMTKAFHQSACVQPRRATKAQQSGSSSGFAVQFVGLNVHVGPLGTPALNPGCA